MRGWLRTGPLAASSAVLSAVIGGLVNILTNSWSWWIFAVATILLSVVAIIAYRLESGQRGPAQAKKSKVEVHAKRNSVIRSSPVKATGQANVGQISDDHSRIENSGITAEGARVKQKAEDGGIIEGSPIIAD